MGLFSSKKGRPSSLGLHDSNSAVSEHYRRALSPGTYNSRSGSQSGSSQAAAAAAAIMARPPTKVDYLYQPLAPPARTMSMTASSYGQRQGSLRGDRTMSLTARRPVVSSRNPAPSQTARTASLTGPHPSAALRASSLGGPNPMYARGNPNQAPSPRGAMAARDAAQTGRNSSLTGSARAASMTSRVRAPGARANSLSSLGSTGSAGGKFLIKTTKTTDGAGRTTSITKETLQQFATGELSLLKTETTTFEHIEEEEEEEEEDVFGEDFDGSYALNAPNDAYLHQYPHTDPEEGENEYAEEPLSTPHLLPVQYLLPTQPRATNRQGLVMAGGNHSPPSKTSFPVRSILKKHSEETDFGEVSPLEERSLLSPLMLHEKGTSAVPFEGETAVAPELPAPVFALPAGQGGADERIDEVEKTTVRRSSSLVFIDALESPLTENEKSPSGENLVQGECLTGDDRLRPPPFVGPGRAAGVLAPRAAEGNALYAVEAFTSRTNSLTPSLKDARTLSLSSSLKRTTFLPMTSLGQPLSDKPSNLQPAGPKVVTEEEMYAAALKVAIAKVYGGNTPSQAVQTSLSHREPVAVEMDPSSSDSDNELPDLSPREPGYTSSEFNGFLAYSMRNQAALKKEQKARAKAAALEKQAELEALKLRDSSARKAEEVAAEVRRKESKKASERAEAERKAAVKAAKKEKERQDKLQREAMREKEKANRAAAKQSKRQKATTVDPLLVPPLGEAPPPKPAMEEFKVFNEQLPLLDYSPEAVVDSDALGRVGMFGGGLLEVRAEENTPVTLALPDLRPDAGNVHTSGAFSSRTHSAQELSETPPSSVGAGQPPYHAPGGVAALTAPTAGATKPPKKPLLRFRLFMRLFVAEYPVKK